MITAITINKGGSLKTTTTVNLAGLLCLQGKRVLIVDADNQANAAISFGHNPDTDYKKTLYDVLVNGTDPSDAIFELHRDESGGSIDILPSNDDLALFDFDILTDPRRFPEPFFLLRDIVSSLSEEYDEILIDAPPNMGLMQGNILTASDRILIPFQPETYAMRSLVKVFQAVEDFKAQHNPGLEILGVFSTLVDNRTKIHEEIIEAASEYVKSRGVNYFTPSISRSIRHAAAIAYDRTPLVFTKPKDPIVVAYRELAAEIGKTNHPGGFKS